MPIDLYTDKPQQALGQVAQRATQFGQQTFGGLFSSPQAQGAMVQQGQMNEARLKEAVDAWGVDIVKNWNQSGRQVLDALQQDLRMMREEATRARQENDMQRYQMALQKSLFDKQMLAYGKLIDSANQHNLLNAILYGVGQVGAGIASKISESKLRKLIEQWKREEKERYRDMLAEVYGASELYPSQKRYAY